MSAPTLSAALKIFDKNLLKLQQYKAQAVGLEAKYQHIISEMIMLRLFSVFEDAVSDIAFRIVAGAKYTNGNTPAIKARASRISDSRAILLNYGRARPETNLKWTKAKFIKESVEYVIPTNEKFVLNTQAQGAIIDEMRRVRNVLAHNTANARIEFKQVIRTRYGANVKISPGAFLCSTRRFNPCNIDYYILTSKAIIHSVASGQ